MIIRWITVVVALAIYSPSAAAAGEMALVLVDGSVTARDKEVATDAVSRTVRAAGWPLASKPLSSKEAATVRACFHDAQPVRCVAQALGSRGVRQVALVSLKQRPNGEGGTEIVITTRLILTATDWFSIGERHCDHCTDDTLSALSSELAQELLDRAATASGRTVLSVKSTPAGARFVVNGEIAGTTNAAINVVPGKYIVSIEHPGYESATRTVECTDGSTGEVSVTLRPTPTEPSSERPTQVQVPERPGVDTTPTRPRLVPGIMIGVGALAIVAGGIAIAFDEDPASRPDDDVQRRYYDTWAPGLVIAAGGAIVGGVGYLLWRRATPRTTPTVAPVAGGAVVGLSRTF